MEWMIMPLKRYADFSGRSRRQEYWMFFLLQMIIYVVLITALVAIAVTNGDQQEPPVAFWILVGVAVLVVLGLFIPNLAVQVRRMHDQNQSGWMILLGFIPYVGGIVMLVFMCIDGTRGPNKYGEDPKEADHLGRVFG